MKLIHISDLHYGQNGAVQGNAPILAHIANREDISECVVICTGDTVETPDVDIYQTATSAKRQMAERCKEYLDLPGNHDIDYGGLMDSAMGAELFADHVEELTGERFTYPSIHCVGGIVFTLVDTCRPPEGRWARAAANITATGMVGDEQIGEIAEMVRAAKAQGFPVVVALHHCPSGGDPLLRLADRRDLEGALDDAGGVDLMLSGHLHRMMEWSHVYGARYLLSAPKMRDSTGYRLIEWDGDKFSFEWVNV